MTPEEYFMIWKPRQLESCTRKICPRELEILKLIMSGLETKAIATKLGISGNTVAVHRNNLWHKLRNINALEYDRSNFAHYLFPFWIMFTDDYIQHMLNENYIFVKDSEKTFCF